MFKKYKDVFIFGTKNLTWNRSVVLELKSEEYDNYIYNE